MSTCIGLSSSEESDRGCSDGLCLETHFNGRVDLVCLDLDEEVDGIDDLF